ncbi:ARM repeat-containing protein [Sporormia fimetaria CBS 119925]|uniref:ARM repeat-containing protein n=1 Tax=Sporormia fimetaria CBS 119925 TaxID=1340428 RepID=A0A6A6UZE1_9PLEO|nr:ARM repeat-containing protein [Sporormia fimetaria CBS 119925]
MATTEEERAVQLAKQADDSVKQGRLPEAARFLREATTLAPDHAQVRAAWAALKGEEQRSPLIGICKDWVKSQDEAVGEKALRLVKGQALSQQNAKEAFEILLDFKGDDEILDEVTGQLLTITGAQQVLVQAIINHPTETYYGLFERGDDSIAGLLKVLLNRDVWPSEEKFVQGHRDCFMLSLAMMMEEALDHPERAMKGVATLLAAYADHLKGIIDADGFDVILASLDIRVSTELRSHATLATVKLLELCPETAQTLITKFVTSRVQEATADRLIVAFSAAAAIFPVAVAAAARLFLIEGFISTLATVVVSKKSHKLEQAALELLNAACVDKACREAISRHCRDWLEDMVASPKTDKHRASSAAVILVKLDQGQQEAAHTAGTSGIVETGSVSQDDLVSRFKEMVISPETQSKVDSVEGLAFASLKPHVRETLGTDPAFLCALISAMKSATQPQVLFGGLTILVNITAYSPLQSEEEKRMAQLKAYANTQKPTSPDPLMDEDHVTARCKQVLSAGTVPFLVSMAKKTASLGFLTSIVAILSSLSHGKSHRGTLAQQGAVKLLISIWDNVTNSPPPSTSSTATAAATAATCAHALSRILISTNPHHIFNASCPSTSAIRPLTSLLTPTDTSPSTWQLHAFESLLALTNLASLDTSTQSAILRTAFDTINDDLLLSNNTLIRRAAAELICNLMAAPLCITKFADPADLHAARRLHILLAISDSDDTATRSAAGGALAMLLAYDEGVDAVLKQKDGQKAVGFLLKLCEDEDEDVRLRGCVCVRSVVGAERAEIRTKGVEVLKKTGAVEVFKRVITGSRRDDVLRTAVEGLRVLMGEGR